MWVDYFRDSNRMERGMKDMFKNSKRGTVLFIASVLICSVVLSTTAYAVSQTNAGEKFLAIISGYLDGVREEKMKEKSPASDNKIVDIKADIQTDLDQAKLDAEVELEQYIEERTAQHLIDLENIRELLKLDILSVKDEELTRQKAKVDAELEAEKEQLLIDLNLDLQ